MNEPISRRTKAAIGLAVLAAFALVTVAPASAQNTESQTKYTVGDIQKRLDRTVGPMSVPPTTQLVDLLQRLEGQGETWLQVPEATLSFLPYGEQTTLGFSVPRVKLRELLDRMLAGFSLRYELVTDAEGNAVCRVMPRRELVRLGHRASIDEIELLGVLQRMRIRSLNQPLKTQIEAEYKRPVDLYFDVSGMEPADAEKLMHEQMAKMQQNSAVVLLDQVCDHNRWAWRVKENIIIVVDKPKQVVHQLRRTVTVQWKDVPVEEALIELGQSAGVLVQFQPAVMENVNEQNRRLTWTIANQQILQTIEKVTARTGLAYEIREESIYFFGPRGSWRSDPIVGMVDVPISSDGATCRMFLRQSMLPEDVHPIVEQRLQSAADSLTRELREWSKDHPAPPTEQSSKPPADKAQP